MWHIRAILACKGPVPKRIGIFIAVHKVNITVFRSRATFINVQTITGVSALIQPSPKTITVVIRKVEIGIICIPSCCCQSCRVNARGYSYAPQVHSKTSATGGLCRINCSFVAASFNGPLLVSHGRGWLENNLALRHAARCCQSRGARNAIPVNTNIAATNRR